MSRLRLWLAALGPGLLMAGAAIGVSHLVQSTRAGASYGLVAVLPVLLANLAKYPFFAFGHILPHRTGKHFLEFFPCSWLWVTLVVMVPAAVGSIAVLGFVSGALAHTLLPLLSVKGWTTAILVLSWLLLWMGHYRGLEAVMRGLMAVLAVTVTVACIWAVWHAQPEDHVRATGSLRQMMTVTALPFLIALMGWMPAPLEMSIWQSLWSVARNAQTGKPTERAVWFDVISCYALTVILALMFVGVGAYMVFDTGQVLPEGAADFAGRVIDLYANVLGPGAWLIIALAALACIVSTTLTLVDAYPRTVSHTLLGLGILRRERVWRDRIAAVFCGAALVIIWGFAGSLKALVDAVTMLSFFTAPVMALMLWKIIKDNGGIARSMQLWAWAGLIYLVGFCVIYATFAL